jgi:uncharacterized protein YqgQ
MGIINEKDESRSMNLNLKKTVETLNYLKLYSDQIENMLIEISNLAKSQVIDFDMFNRGLRKILLKKGDKKKNIEEYFSFYQNMSLKK